MRVGTLLCDWVIIVAWQKTKCYFEDKQQANTEEEKEESNKTDGTNIAEKEKERFDQKSSCIHRIKEKRQQEKESNKDQLKAYVYELYL